MKMNLIKCEAVEVKTESGVCSGKAQTKIGENHTFGVRTPSDGICSNAFCALSNSAFVMMTTKNLRDEKDGYIERVCPHGVVTFRLSRVAK